MKLFLSIVIFCLLFASCSNNKKIKIPQNVIGKDTMVSVLTDIHLIKAAQQLGTVIDTTDTSKFASFNYVWKKHHITENEYEKSLDFYTHNPAILDSIYENVLNNFNKQRAELLARRHLK